MRGSGGHIEYMIILKEHFKFKVCSRFIFVVIVKTKTQAIGEEEFI